MLISHKYKFIFVKTTKTAGTSLEVDLSEILGEEDVVTPIIPPEARHRPRNYSSFFGLRKTFYNHMPATAIRKKVGAKTFDSYFKFCVEREPVSKCVSHYSMLKNSPHHNRRNSGLTWDVYVENGHFPIDAEKYLDADGRFMLDRILRYENLEAEINEIAAQQGFSFDGIKSRAKSGYREPPIVTRKQREVIYSAFAPTLKYTSYEL